MKIYSYLHSGRAIVATSLPTHTQVLNSAVAELAAPNADDFSKALLLLLSNKEYRHTLGAQGRSLAEAKYTRAAYSTTLNTAYNYLLEALKS